MNRIERKLWRNIFRIAACHYIITIYLAYSLATIIDSKLLAYSERIMGVMFCCRQRQIKIKKLLRSYSSRCLKDEVGAVHGMKGNGATC